VAFSGRSNVGKSSLINRLLGRKRLAAVSSTPGKTRRIHFFRINDLFYLVDLPGYGYTNAPLKVSAEWRALVDRYLDSSTKLAGVVCLVDIRRELADTDRRLLVSLAERQIPLMIALTKADKLGRQKQTASARSLVAALNAAVAEEQVIATSATTGQGCSDLLDELAALVSQVQPRH
jgi:GTP-binding protein